METKQTKHDVQPNIMLSAPLLDNVIRHMSPRDVLALYDSYRWARDTPDATPVAHADASWPTMMTRDTPLDHSAPRVSSREVKVTIDKNNRGALENLNNEQR